MNAIVPNSSFSVVQRNLQIAWDSTSIADAKKCWRYYYLTRIEGWTSKLGNVHLEFGILVHRGKELFERFRAQGLSHDDACVKVVRELMIATWDSNKKRPWQTDDSYKNRFTLIRSLVWYFEEYKNDVLKTVIFANRKPAVELSFSFNANMRARTTNEEFVLCGHIDRLVEWNTNIYPADVKTTKHAIDERFFSQYTPGGQFSLYHLAPEIVWHMPAKGIIVDAIHIQVNSTKFGRDTVTRSEAQLQEWLSGFYDLAGQAEGYAKRNFWPMNETSCDKYGGCVFRRVCSHAPSARLPWLAADFKRQPASWDPLKVRTDV
jgi:hypothetical protein